MAELTVLNFIDRIKRMPPKARGKLTAEELINLIIQLPDDIAEPNQPILQSVNDLMATVTQFQQTQTQFQQTLFQHTQQIQNLQEANDKTNRVNGELAVECTKLSTENSDMKAQIEGIETYLRVNNIEISGLDDPIFDEESQDLETVEQQIINCINNIDEEVEISSDDIDICHELPGRNGGKTHIVRFVQRTVKDSVIKARKKRENRDYKFRNKAIFVNEHLTLNNKNLFNLAKEKKMQKVTNFCGHAMDEFLFAKMKIRL